MTTLVSLVRFFHLAAQALLLGGFAFFFFVAWPAYKKGGPEVWGDFQRFHRSWLELAGWSLGAALFFSFLGLWTQAATITSRPLFDALRPDALGGILTGTQYGTVWIVRLIIIALLAGTLLLHRQRKASMESKAIHLIGLVLAACLIAALAFSGHAAAGEGTSLLLQLSADALHLLTAATWLGGLLPLVVLLGWARRLGSPSARIVAQEATRRFSLLGIGSVSVLLLSGLFNGWNLVRGVAPLFGTAYGRLLLAKIGLLLPLMGLAALNLLELKPRILALQTESYAGELLTLLKRLRRSVLAELGLGFAIVLVVGLMGVTPPARHTQPDWPFSFRWSWQVIKGNTKLRSQASVGGYLAAAGLLIFGCAAITRRQRHWAMGVGMASLGYGCLVALPTLSIDAYPTTYKRPSVPYNAISVAHGAFMYRESCIVCHGVGGYGDGPVAKELKPRPANLTAKHTGDHTAGDLFWWLIHGVKETAMPGFNDSLSEEEYWDLINFMRTLAAAEQARSMAALVEPDPWLVAPDFVYRTDGAEAKSLKDHRGEKIVLLVLFTLPSSEQRLQQLDLLASQFRDLGVQVLAVPWDARGIHFRLGLSARALPVVTDGSQEIFETYALFRRSFSERGTLPDPPIPPHMEFLIDRQGYVRARWIPGEGRGWADTDALLRELDRLRKEKPTAPAPDEHVH